METAPQRAPRPKSADFLTAEAVLSSQAAPAPGGNGVRASGMTAVSSKPASRRRATQQPQRPKSSIDSRMLSDEYWTELEHKQQQQPLRARKESFVSEQISYYNNQQQKGAQQGPTRQQPQQHRQQSQPQPHLPASSGHQQKLYPPPNLNSANDSSTLDSNDEVSQYFPTPTTRMMGPPPRQPYLNLPENSTAVLRQRPETATPGRLTRGGGGGGERESSAGGSDAGSSILGGGGEFRRSASARLHRGRKGGVLDGVDGDDGRRREQVSSVRDDKKLKYKRNHFRLCSFEECTINLTRREARPTVHNKNVVSYHLSIKSQTILKKNSILMPFKSFSLVYPRLLLI